MKGLGLPDKPIDTTISKSALFKTPTKIKIKFTTGSGIPVQSMPYKNVIFRRSDGFATAYGKGNLNYLNWLEEGTKYSSKQWMNMSPVFKYKPKIGISNVSIIGSKIQLDSKKIFDRLSKPDVRLSMLQRTGLDISSITTPAMGTVSLNMMRQLQSQRVDTKYKPQLKMKQITKTDIDEPSYPMFKIPTPPSIKTTSTPFTIPSFLFEDDYTKRMLKNMSFDKLFGKGWRKRSWLNNKDVI